MINFVFISCNYPTNYIEFTRALKKNGVRVLGIVDSPISHDLAESLDDFYTVMSFQDRDEMIRALGYFTYKYGKIDWIESNNEFWLENDAYYRQQFNVTTGVWPEQLKNWQSKSAMKKYYKKAGLPVAHYQLVTDLKHAKQFVKKYGYPVVIKPDQGVGASNTTKIKNEEQLVEYFNEPIPEQMIMEQYVKGTVSTFDGIVNKDGEIVYCTSHCYTDSIMETMSENKGMGCYSQISIPKDLMEAGKKTIKAFGVTNRFFHFEFFRLSEDCELGPQGQILGLEVNMRPPGGIIPDLMNYAKDINVYEIWANTIINNNPNYNPLVNKSSLFYGRRNGNDYKVTEDMLKEKYNGEIISIFQLTGALAEGMGDTLFIARFDSMDRVKSFIEDCGK